MAEMRVESPSLKVNIMNNYFRLIKQYEIDDVLCIFVCLELIGILVIVLSFLIDIN